MQSLETRAICINSLGNCDKNCQGNKECNRYEPLYKLQIPYRKGIIAYALQKRGL